MQVGESYHTAQLTQCECVCVCVCHLLLFSRQLLYQFRFLFCVKCLRFGIKYCECSAWNHSFKASSLHSLGGRHVFTYIHTWLRCVMSFYHWRASISWLRCLLCVLVFRHHRCNSLCQSRRMFSNRSHTHHSYWWACLSMILGLYAAELCRFCYHSISMKMCVWFGFERVVSAHSSTCGESCWCWQCKVSNVAITILSGLLPSRFTHSRILTWCSGALQSKNRR